MLLIGVIAAAFHLYAEQIKAFNWSGYHFDESRSTDTEYVFIRTEIPEK